MEEPIVPLSHTDSTDRVTTDERKARSRRTAKERSRVREADAESAAARTDAFVWQEHFNARAQEIFLLFRDQEMYNRYIEVARQSLEYTVAMEREDARMRERWDELRDAFCNSFEAGLFQKEAQKPPAKPARRLPFTAQIPDRVSGVEARARRLYGNAREWFIGRRRLPEVDRRKQAVEEEFVENSWRMHKIHRLVINRKLRRTQNDSMDILVEEAA